MGRRGPKPESNEEKLAKGNPGKRPLNHEEPQLAAGDLEAPTDVAAKPVAVAEWNRLALELHKKGLLTIGDRVVFAQYCKQKADVEEWEALVEKVGKADAVKLGYAGRLHQSRALLRQYASECGLSPTSRRTVRADRSGHKAKVETPDAPARTKVGTLSLKERFGIGVVRGGSAGS